MGNYSAGMEGMPNIFNFIPESKSSGMNDLPGLLALTRDGNNNNDNGWGGQWAVWLIFILAFCNGGWIWKQRWRTWRSSINTRSSITFI